MVVSQKPIVLWNTTKHTAHIIDDAGVFIKQSLLPPPVRAPQYRVHQPTFTGVVPPLAYFCIKALSPFPEQLHTLAHLQFSYRDDLARALFPLRSQLDEDIQQSTQCSGAPNFDTTALDPRLWATFAQIIHPLPEQLHDLDLPLANIHLPLLQQIPNTPIFSLVTLLSLPNCNHVCDDTISELRRLNSLVALDLRGTNITPYALTVLARGLSWTSDDDSASRRRTGLWGLRILRLHSCTRIDNKAISVLQKFPLLSVVDLRFTQCTGSAVKRHLSSLGFSSSGHKHLFHPAPLSLALYTFDNLATTASNPISPYSCPLHSVFRIHVDELYHSTSHHRTGTEPNARNVHSSAQHTTVFIPPVPKLPVAQNAKVSASSKCVSTLPLRRRPSTAPKHWNLIHAPWSSNNVASVPLVPGPSAAQGSESPKSRMPIFTTGSRRSSSSKFSLRNPQGGGNPPLSLPTGIQPDMPMAQDDSLPTRRLSLRSRPDDGTVKDMDDVEWEHPNDYYPDEEDSPQTNSDYCWESEECFEVWDEESSGRSDEEFYPYGEVYDSEILRGFPSSHRAASVASTDTALLPRSHSSSSIPTSHVPLPSLSRCLSSFYEGVGVGSRRPKRSNLTLPAQTVHSSEDGRLDPLAVARLPPPWSTLDAYTPLAIPDGFRSTPTQHGVSFSEHKMTNARQRRPVFGWTDAALSDPAKLDRARLNKQGSGAFANMVDKLATKRLKVVSQFALAKVQAQVPAKARNPFAKSAKSVFAESNPTISGAVKRPLFKHESLTEAEPEVPPHSRNTVPSNKKRRLEGTDAETSSKPLKPITTLKPPILPKEFLPLPPKQPSPASKPATSLKQARLSFTRPEQSEKPRLVPQKRGT
ncbi:hypothetical protein BDN67DRAFT_921164 [Paxillus ammoniavirescens]|nr:hypothetical protein BDN67DRAFT_921164 [Paxillus ammoniavirescens]